MSNGRLAIGELEQIVQMNQTTNGRVHNRKNLISVQRVSLQMVVQRAELVIVQNCLRDFQKRIGFRLKLLVKEATFKKSQPRLTNPELGGTRLTRGYIAAQIFQNEFVGQRILVVYFFLLLPAVIIGRMKLFFERKNILGHTVGRKNNASHLPF